MSNPYTPVLTLLALGFGFAALSVGTSLVVGPARYNRAKSEAYECGIQPTPRAQTGQRVPILHRRRLCVEARRSGVGLTVVVRMPCACLTGVATPPAETKEG